MGIAGRFKEQALSARMLITGLTFSGRFVVHSLHHREALPIPNRNFQKGLPQRVFERTSKSPEFLMRYGNGSSVFVYGLARFLPLVSAVDSYLSFIFQ
ncbi:hypothetical protein [Acetobacter conturbans]|uniref:hypothetical protein n=1 Tax=Acetobacter conturbans TaxID=1737472 RepID=UPI001569F776|nr:hypothetical protein [Acetobacter conturbans]